MGYFNILTGEGFCEAIGKCGFNINWGLSCLAIVLTVFFALILKRQTEDGVLSGVSYNFIGSMALGVLAAGLIVTFTGDPRWTILAGIGGLALGGFGLGIFTGSSDGGYE